VRKATARRRGLAALLAAGIVLAPGAATAWPDDSRTYDEEWSLDVQAQTELPTQLGGRLTLETPYRLRITTSLGWLPPAYLDLVNVILVSAGAYPQATADLLSAALDDALLWKVHVGWRPVKHYGFYIELGYALATLGGGVGAEEIITRASGQKPLAGLNLAGKSYAVDATLHMIDAEAGWICLVAGEAMSIRLAVGFTATLAARATVKPRFTVPAAFRAKMDTWAAEAESYLEKTCRQYVFTPTIGLGIGWRPF
jgi:hypothetical protein